MTAESAERRAERKMMARLYASMPSKETFDAAARYETTKMQSQQQSLSAIFQVASLMTGIAGNLPPTEERNRHLAEKARNFLDRYLDEANTQLDEYIKANVAERANRLEDDEQEEPSIAS